MFRRSIDLCLILCVTNKSVTSFSVSPWYSTNSGSLYREAKHFFENLCRAASIPSIIRRSYSLMALYFNENEHAAVSVTERVCSAVSLAGSGIVVATFIGSTSFRKPVNRLVFYASFGNIMANVGTMISESGVHRGQHSSLCQFQAFTIQWLVLLEISVIEGLELMVRFRFLPADSLWALAMACNVYLALFHNYSTDHLRPLEWKYFVLCYGLPFIPALVLAFINTKSNGKAYGLAIVSSSPCVTMNSTIL